MRQTSAANTLAAPVLGPDTGAMARASIIELCVPAGVREAPGLEARARELAFEDSLLRQRPGEGIAAATYEAVTGRRLARPDPADPAYDYDFLDEAGRRVRVDVKGPVPLLGGPVPDARLEGLIRKIIREADFSSGSDMVLVDALGLSEAQHARVRVAVEAAVRSSKIIVFMRDAPS